MRRSLLLSLCLALFLVVGVMGVIAQGAPQAINVALADLNERLGTSYTLNDFNWSWEQVRFADTSLDCPMEGQVYTQVEVVGYRFIFEVQGNRYDYRVSADETILVLCSTTSLDDLENQEDDQPIGSDDEEPYTNPLCPAPPEGITYMPTRLTTQIQARVAPGLPNNLRAEPSTNGAVIGEIPGEGIFTTLAGPTCDELGYLWWQVDFDGLVGWTAEGRNGDYLLEPLTGTPLPVNRAPITSANMTNLSETSRLQANFGEYLGWSQSTEVSGGLARLVVSGGFGGDGAWLYDVNDLSVSPQFIPSSVGLTDISFGVDPNLALFGSENGALRLWDVSGGEGLVERAFLQGHDTALTAVAFTPNGTIIAGSSDGRAFLQEDLPENQYAISLWDVNTVALQGGLRGHTDTVTGLTFTADSQRLISVSLDGSARIWQMSDRANIITLDSGAPITSMALSRNGQVVALGQANGSIVLWDIVNNTTLGTLVNHLSAVNGLAFGADDSVLASAGEDGVVLAWDLTNIAQGTPMVLSGHNGAVLDVIFSLDGTMIASLGDDNSIRIWTATVNVG